MSTLWLYPSTSSLTLYPYSSSTWEMKSSRKAGSPKSTDASLRQVNEIFLNTEETCFSLKQCTTYDTGQKKEAVWHCWKCKLGALHVLCQLLVAGSRIKPSPESILYQPGRATYQTVSSIVERLVYWWLYTSICRMQLSLGVDSYARSLLLEISHSEISEVKWSLEPIHPIDTDIWITRCIFGYQNGITCY